MACGQKKQNNQEGGVHLTERTCSPYNPIIKQMVDDCLGLPIYPVSSIDAVIDENGNTLRKLLDELVDQINGGQSDLTGIIKQIQLTIATIEENYLTEQDLTEILNTYVTKESLNNLKSLLWAISALKNINNVNENTDLYELDGVTPKIVAAVNQLRTDINSIIDGGDGVSLDSLNKAIKALGDLLLAVANFDEEAHNEEGLEHYENNHQIKIVKKILDIKSELQTIRESLQDSEDPDSIISQINSLWRRIGELQGQIDDLIRDKETFALLDEYVMRQCPEGASESVKNRYKVLRFSQYPPTSAYFIRNNGDSPDNLTNKLLYFGLFNPVSARQTLNYYPFGHTDENKGWPLEYKLPNETVYHPLMADSEYDVQLRAGDDKLSGDDLMQICTIIQGPDPIYKVGLREDMPSDLKYSNLYINLGNDNHVLVGTVNSDNEVNIGDVQATIDAMMQQTITMPSQTEPSSNQSTGWLMFTAGNQTTIMFPCIEGKLYSDIFTGNIYRYSAANIEGVPHMIPVSNIGFNVVEGDTGPIVSENIEYLYEDANLGPYKKYTITIPKHTEYVAGKGITIQEGENKTAIVATDTTDFPTESILEPQSNNDLYKLSLDEHELKLNVTPTLIYIRPDNIDDAEEGKFYLDLNKAKILAYPDCANGDGYKFDVQNVVDSIDTLLNGLTLPDQTQKLDTILEYVLQAFNSHHDQDINILSELKDGVQGITPNINLQSGHINTVRYNYVYQTTYKTETGTEETEDVSGTAYGQIYAESALNASYNIDGSPDNLFQISDITALIDAILRQGTKDELKKVYNDTEVGATLKYYNGQTYEQCTVDTYAYLKDRIFKLVDGDAKTWEWYYFNKEGNFVRMLPPMELTFDSTEKNLMLYSDNRFITQCKFDTDLDTDKEISPIKVNSTSFLGASESSQLQGSHGMDIPGQNLPVFHPTNIREDTFAGQVQSKAIVHLNYNVEKYDGSQTQSDQEFIDLINGTKSARYYKCFDLVKQQLIYTLEIISFEVVDPNDVEENDTVVTVGNNVTVKVLTDVEEIRRFDIQDDVLYNIPQYGLTVKFTHENDSLIPIIVSIEHRRAPESRITDTATKTTAVVYPNEFLEIRTITSDKLTFNISNLTQAIEPDLIPVRGIFVGKDQLEISFYEPDNQYTITSLSSNPTIENGKTYGYEIFNRTFKVWEL